MEQDLSPLELNKKAERLFRDKSYKEAEEIFLQLINYPKYEEQIGMQTSFRMKIAKCRYYIEDYKGAGDILLEACNEILYYDNALLKYTLSTKLIDAYRCYKLAGMQLKCEEILQHPYLLEVDKRHIGDMTDLFKY